MQIELTENQVIYLRKIMQQQKYNGDKKAEEILKLLKRCRNSVGLA